MLSRARKYLLMVALTCAALGPAASSQYANAQTTADAGDVATLEQAITRTTANETQNIRVSATSLQIIVTVLNSPLLTATNAEREGEARLIADAVAEVIAQRPALAKVQALHVDYARNLEGNRVKAIVDGIDFRRDPGGTFQLHRT